MKLQRGQTYRFEWNDTYNFVGWHYEEDLPDKEVETFQQSVGFFIKEATDWYIIAGHRNLNTKLGFPEWGNLVYIPKRSVKVIKKLS